MSEEVQNNCLEILKRHLSEDIYYGISAEDEMCLRGYICEAFPNPQKSLFPDFLFSNGFIEHFQVTSSASNRKGSLMEREKHDLEVKFEEKEEAIKNEMENTPCYEGVDYSVDMWHKSHSYDNLVKSFKSSWTHHIDSLSKYTGTIEHSLFMVYYADSGLTHHKKYPSIKQGLIYGDLFTREKHRCYRLSRDRELLEYVYGYKDYIQYVIFINVDAQDGEVVEIISVENIPELQKLLGLGYHVGNRIIGTAHIGFGISTPVHPEKRNEKNDPT